MTEFKAGDRVTISKYDTTITGVVNQSALGDLCISAAPIHDGDTNLGFLLRAYREFGWNIELAKPLLPTVPGSVIRYSDDFFVLTEAGNWASEYDTWEADDFEDDPEFTVIFVNTKIVEDAPVEDA